MPPGRIIALDLGEKRVGVAVSDESGLTVRPLQALPRTNWKRLLRDVIATLESFDAKALVIGLPLSLDGTEKEAAEGVRRTARNFEMSVGRPVYLVDERLTSRAAEEELLERGYTRDRIAAEIDSASAAIILGDFLAERRRAQS